MKVSLLPFICKLSAYTAFSIRCPNNDPILLLNLIYVTRAYTIIVLMDS